MQFRNLLLLIFFLSRGAGAFSQLTQEINPGLISREWDAHWITHPDVNEQYGVYHFRKSFEIDELPSKFIIHISADNRYWLYINGKRICTGPAKGDLAHWQFESLDIASFLKKGENLMAVEVWNHGDYKAIWQQSFRTGLVIQGNSFSERIVNTDTTWKVLENFAYFPRFDGFRDVGARETLFAARYPTNWNLPGADESLFTWAVHSEKAIPVGVPGAYPRKMMQREIPLAEETVQRFASIREVENLPFTDDFIKGKGVLTVPPFRSVTLLIDQEYLTTAYPELVLSGGMGSTITLTYMEAPFENVPMGWKGNRNEVENKIVHGYSDVIYPSGDEGFLFRPLFYRTFRYIEIKIQTISQPLTINDFSSKFTAYPFEEKGHFASSDSSLTDIWNTGWRTARLCAFDTYMDCPYYEQLQYIGDTRIQALVSLYVSGDDRLMRNAISQFYDSRIEEGLTQSRYPVNEIQIIPPFSLFWTAMIHDYWMHRPDINFVKQYLGSIKEVLDWHKNRIDLETEMLGKLEFWNFVDWPKEWPWLGQAEISGVPLGSASGNSSIYTLQYVMAIQKSCDLFEAFGMKEVAEEYREIASSLKESTYRLCWDNKRQMLADLPDKSEFSQHANVLAVLTGLPSGLDAAGLMTRTMSDTSLVQCTVYYRFYLNEAMRKAGLGNRYIEMLAPWHQMLSIGLTTFAEKPEPSRSDCHAWSASPNYHLLSIVLGITPGSPGFKTVHIEPHLGDLQFAEGSVPTPAGMIDVNMKRSGVNGIEAEIVLPEGMKGEFSWAGKKTAISEGKQFIKR